MNGSAHDKHIHSAVVAVVELADEHPLSELCSSFLPYLPQLLKTRMYNDMSLNCGRGKVEGERGEEGCCNDDGGSTERNKGSRCRTCVGRVESEPHIGQTTNTKHCP